MSSDRMASVHTLHDVARPNHRATAPETWAAWAALALATSSLLLAARLALAERQR